MNAFVQLDEIYQQRSRYRYVLKTSDGIDWDTIKNIEYPPSENGHTGLGLNYRVNSFFKYNDSIYFQYTRYHILKFYDYSIKEISFKRYDSLIYVAPEFIRSDSE